MFRTGHVGLVGGQKGGQRGGGVTNHKETGRSDFRMCSVQPQVGQVLNRVSVHRAGLQRVRPAEAAASGV